METSHNETDYAGSMGTLGLPNAHPHWPPLGKNRSVSFRPHVDCASLRIFIFPSSNSFLLSIIYEPTLLFRLGVKCVANAALDRRGRGPRRSPTQNAQVLFESVAAALPFGRPRVANAPWNKEHLRELTPHRWEPHATVRRNRFLTQNSAAEVSLCNFVPPLLCLCCHCSTDCRSLCRNTGLVGHSLLNVPL